MKLFDFFEKSAFVNFCSYLGISWLEVNEDFLVWEVTLLLSENSLESSSVSKESSLKLALRHS